MEKHQSTKLVDPNTWWEGAVETVKTFVAPAPAAKVEISTDDRARLAKLFGSAVPLPGRLANFATLSEDDQGKALELFPDFEAPRFNSPEKAERDQAEELALAKVKHERQAFDAERTTELVARNEADEHAVQYARSRACETRKALAVALALDVHAALAPLWKAFREEPGRLISLQIADAWQKLDARCELELGAKLNAHMLCVTLLELFGGSARKSAQHAGGYFDFSPTNYGNAADRAIRQFPSGDPALIFDVLVALEQSVAKAVAVAPQAGELAARRFAAFRASVTNVDAALAVDACEAQWKAERDAANPLRAPAPLGEDRRGTSFASV